MRITVKEQNFCIEYIRNGGNATKAYQKFYKAKNDNVAGASSAKVLSKPKIQQFLATLRNKSLEKHNVTFERLVEENAKVAFQDLNEVLEKTDDGFLKLKDEDFDLNNLHGVTLSKSTSDGEKGYSESKSFSIKVSDKLKALQELAKLMGAYERRDNPIRDKESNARSILDAIRKIRK